MEQTIQKALDNIYNRRKNSRDLLRENTLNRWVSGSIGSEELGERAAVLGINLYQPEYCVVCAVRRGKIFPYGVPGGLSGTVVCQL